jgi:hypothetical protein
VPGCTVLIGDVSHLLHHAVFGAAAACGNAGFVPAPVDIAIPVEIRPPLADFAANVRIGPQNIGQRDAKPTLSSIDLPPKITGSRPNGLHFSGGYAFYGFPKLEQVVRAQMGPGSVGSAARFGTDQAAANSDASPGLTEFSAPGSSLQTGSTLGDPQYHRFEQPSPEGEADAAEAAEPGGGLILNGGYSSIEGVSTGVQINRTNVMGPGTEVRAGARYSKVRTLYEAGFSDRSFLDGSMAFASKLFIDRIAPRNIGKGVRFAPFRQSTRGIDIVLNRKFKSGLSASINYRLSDELFKIKGKGAVCDSTIYGSSLCAALGDTTRSVLSAGLGFAERTRRGGTIFDVKLRLVQDLTVGGTASFTRTSLEGGVNIILNSALQLSFNLEGGHILPIDKKNIPLFDRFFIGEASVRGFDLRGIGPRILPTAANPDQFVGIGGRTYYAARSELSVAVGGPLGIRGIRPGIFVDIGSVFGANKSALLPGEILTGNSAKPRVSVGVGVGMKTPAGNFRIDLARPVVKQPGDRSKLLSISFGAAI